MTYQPPPLRMKGAADRRRRTAPPHVSQVLSGGSEMRCLASNVRWQDVHSYS